MVSHEGYVLKGAFFGRLIVIILEEVKPLTEDLFREEATSRCTVLSSPSPALDARLQS
jgi:hypothetical protein